MTTPTRTPFVLVGDLLGQPTGLSRILTDLAVHLSQDVTLNLDVRVCGWVNWEGLPTTGVETTSAIPDDIDLIPAWAFNTVDHWGKRALETAYRRWFGDRAGIVLTVWDAHRCWGVSQADIPVQWWGYVPVDGVNVNGMIGGGPVREALAKYDRLLAYSEFGAAAISATLAGTDARANIQYRDPTPTNRSYQTWGMSETQHLPHGLNTSVWRPGHDHEKAFGFIPDETRIIGCVATNQARKDWGLVAATLARLRDQGLAVHGWWHTDKLVTDAWSLPQLVEDFDLDGLVTVTTTLTDYQLADAYRACAATIAPGRGEGFGYPIVESLACGTPVIHCDYAGGAEFLPPVWRTPAMAYHVEGAYGIARPMIAPMTAATVLDDILRAGPLSMDDRTALHNLWAAPLNWDVLWPRWRSWIQEGL